jgi:hypothetical protein
MFAVYVQIIGGFGFGRYWPVLRRIWTLIEFLSVPLFVIKVCVLDFVKGCLHSNRVSLIMKTSPVPKQIYWLRQLLASITKNIASIEFLPVPFSRSKRDSTMLITHTEWLRWGVLETVGRRPKETKKIYCCDWDQICGQWESCKRMMLDKNDG